MAIYLRVESISIIEVPVVLKCIHNKTITKVLSRKVIEETEEYFQELYAEGWRCEQSHGRAFTRDIEIRNT